MSRKYMFMVIAALGFLTSCSLFPKKEKKLVFVLFDVSDSTMEKTRRDAYAKEFDEKILSSLVGGDLVIGDKITDNPLAQSSFPINFNIQAYSLLGDETERTELNQSERVRISTTVVNLLESNGRRIMQTKILDSLKLAERVFASYPEYQNKILVIFSDMIEESDSYNFNRMNLTQNTSAEIVSVQKKQNTLPDLKGVKIYISGATASSAGGLDSNKINSVKTFWINYFLACGASLSPNNYGPVIIRFEGGR